MAGRLSWSVLCGDQALNDSMSFGMGGVMMANTDWSGGLRDRVLLSDAGRRGDVDAQSMQRSSHIKTTAFPDSWDMNPTHIGILVFGAAAVLGPLYAVAGYSPIRDVISLLGAQNTPNSTIMMAGFLALGLGIVVDGLRRFAWSLLPFILFGLCMGLAGVFAHKPLSPDVAFNQSMHQAHSVLATAAGISITTGLLWRAFQERSLKVRIIHVVLALLCFVLPLCMLTWPDYQGGIQRLMYLLILGWFWLRYPKA